ncbi:hypothetical protein GCM10020229_15620 [Kitasatospora albolonga]
MSISGPVTLDALPLPYGFVRFDGAEVPRDRWLADGATIDGRGVVDDPIGGQDARLQRTLSCGQVLWATLPSAMAALARPLRRDGLAVQLRPAPARPAGPGPPGAGVPHAAARRDRSARHRPHPARLGPGRVGGVGGPAGLDADRPRAGCRDDLLSLGRRRPGPRLRKVHATRAVAETVDELRHRCGLSGFFGENRLSEYLGLARAFENAGGDNTLTLMDAGRALAEGTALPTELGEDLPAPTGPGWWPAVLAALQDASPPNSPGPWPSDAAPPTRGSTSGNPLLADVLLLGEVHAARLAADAPRQPARAAATFRVPLSSPPSTDCAGPTAWPVRCWPTASSPPPPSAPSRPPWTRSATGFCRSSPRSSRPSTRHPAAPPSTPRSTPPR